MMFKPSVTEDPPTSTGNSKYRPFPSDKKLYLKFDASQSEPEFRRVFMENGGQINAAATRWETDFSLTGSNVSTAYSLERHRLTEVTLEIPSENVQLSEPSEAQEACVCIPSETRLNISTTRVGAAINGTLVTTISGQGSDHLFNVVRPVKHYQIGLVYASWMAHAASVGISNARYVVVDDTGNEQVYSVEYQKRSTALAKELELAAKLVNAYVNSGWNFRQAVRYSPSPALTKTVFKEPVGVNGSGYSLVHDIVERGVPMSLKALNSLYAAAVSVDVCQDKNDVSAFLKDTKSPGLKAAACARVVASATSLIVNYLVAYRADGRNVLTAMGADFSSAESWLRQVSRTPTDANDCDGSALLAVGMLRAVVAITKEQEADPKYPYLRAVKNVVHPYYHVGISVLGASAAEATSAKSDHSTVAGHAIAVMVPAVGFLKSLSKAMKMTLGPTDQKVAVEEMIPAIEESRFAAMFPKRFRERLPKEEQEMLSSWPVAKNSFDEVAFLAIEGTTPASPVMYQPDTSLRSQAEEDAKKDEIALSKSSPNVARSIKVLHVGGSASGSTHRFYRDLVEITFARSFPLYQDQTLRALNVAASQYILGRTQNANAFSEAGATPKDLALGEYVSVPLVSMNQQAGKTLDVASLVAEKDVIPARPAGPTKLTAFQSSSLRKSMNIIKDLSTSLGQDTIGGHCVAYEFAFSTLVHNPSGVEHFAKAISSVATSGVVDVMMVEDLATFDDGTEAGYFVSVNAYVPV